MTPEQIELVQQTFQDFDHGALAVEFYEQLFTRHPELRSLFSTEPEVQRQKFIDELSAIVWSISNLTDFLDIATSLGARHVSYGTQTSHYPLVREAMLSALADQLADRWTDAVEDAWRAAYDLVAEAMMLGAAEAEGYRPVT